MVVAMMPVLRQKAAAFRRGGFLLFAALFSVALVSSVYADEPIPVEPSGEERKEVLRDFVLANVEFTLLHEIGHALIHRPDCNEQAAYGFGRVVVRVGGCRSRTWF